MNLDEQRRRDALLEDMRGMDLLSLADFSHEQVQALIRSAIDMKSERARGHYRAAIKGKSVALIFFKPSTRTRVSFEVATFELGAHPLVLHADELQLGRGETIEDTARVLSRYVHAIVIRTFAQSDIERMAEAASVPVINALTDDYHPVQILSDLQTIAERFGTLKGLRLVYVGDGNNVAHSLMIGGCKMGMDVVIATPDGYRPDSHVVDIARREAEQGGGRLTLTNDAIMAVQGAHVVYTDTWVSMGQEDDRDEKLSQFDGFQVNAALMRHADENAVAMHCLPAHVGEEISADVYNSDQCIVFDQAENRLHMQKALLAALL